MKQIVLHEDASDYGRYKIIEMQYEDRPARVLFAGTAPQSGIALDDEPELLFDYNQRFLEIALSTQPKSILVIGGGTLTLPFALSQRLPDSVIDVVEIDELLPQLASQFFESVDPARVTIHIADGVTFMQANKKRYDYIVIDAFSGYDIAQPLLTSDIVALYKNSLTAGGVVAVNFISRYLTRRPTLARTLSATFSTVFDDVALYPADHEYAQRAQQNLVLVGAAMFPSLDYLQSSAVTLPSPIT